MASLPRTSRVSQSSSTFTSHREQQVAKATENEADKAQALPSLKDEHGHTSISTNNHVTRKRVSPHDAMSESITSIVGGFVAGISLAISHHVFLAFLNGRSIDQYPQYWIKNANNAFSALFAMCIAFVATCALIQMKWNVAGSKAMSMRSIDNVFALPSPVALFKTVKLTRLRSLRIFLPLIIAATFIQSLALVNIFAPNALTVTRSADISRDIEVPTLDLSTGPITSMTARISTSYTSASQLWTTVLTSIMLQPPILNWKIPPGCGATCRFDLVYEGPGLQCSDAPLEPPPNTESNEYQIVYNATSTLYPIPQANPSSFWEIEDQYDLRIGYIATNASNTGHDGGSVYCVFRNATYKASFQVENNTMEVNHVIQSYGDILGTVKYGQSDLPCSWYGDEPCFINGLNTRAMCEVFASDLTGKMQPSVIEIEGTIGRAPEIVFQTSNITGGINVALIDLLFSHADSSLAVDFHLAVHNLSENLVSLFSNLTFGYIPHRNDTTTVRAELWDGSYAWSYTGWILWAVYLPALLLASLVILSGLLSIRSNKRGMDDKFSNFLFATRNTGLGDVCMGAADFEELRLLYQREKDTFLVASDDDYTK